MKKKIIANMALGLIIITVIGIVAYFILTMRSNTLGDVKNGETSIKFLLSFDYTEYNDDELNDYDDQTRLMSMLVLMNMNTRSLGVLELPAYTGVYNNKDRLILPIDMVYRESGYKDYVALVESTFNISNLHYIHIKENEVANFIDLLGGLKIFLIGEEVSVESLVAESLGDTFFDGKDTRDYLNHVENDDLNEEILKSTKRKEFINAIIKQIQQKKSEYEASTKMMGYIYKHIDTSLTKSDVNKLFLLLSDFDLDEIYFQRIPGELKDVDLQLNKQTNKIPILFTSSEVGGLANILKTVESKLMTNKKTNLDGEITVTILNGTSVSGLASKTKKLFTEAGFNVISIGNSNDTTLESTTLIDRIGDKNKANLAAKVIGIRSIITDITSVDEAGAELTIILGKDFNGEIVK